MISTKTSATWVSNVIEQEEFDSDWVEYQPSTVSQLSEYVINVENTTSSELAIEGTLDVEKTIIVTDGVYINKGIVGTLVNTIGSVNIYDISELALPYTPVKVFKKPTELYMSFEKPASRCRASDLPLKVESATTTTTVVTHSTGETGIIRTGDLLETIISGVFTGATYDSNFTTGQQYDVRIFFKPDGMSAYIAATRTNDSRIYQFNLTTPFDLTTASMFGNIFINTQESYPFGIFINPTGTLMYVVGGANRRVYQYTMSTAWDITTAVYSNKSYSVYTQTGNNPSSLTFTNNGENMYVVSHTNLAIYQYKLATPWDISTAYYDNKTLSLNIYGAQSNPWGIYLVDDNTFFILTKIGNSAGIGPRIDKYKLGVANDIRTGVVQSSQLVDITPFLYSMSFNADLTKVFLGSSNGKIHYYNVSGLTDIKTTLHATVYNATPDTITTGNAAVVLGTKVWDISKDILSFTSTAVSTPAGLSKMLFSEDGTTLYLTSTTVGSEGYQEFNLTVPYDVSTKTQTYFLNVSSQTLYPRGMSFDDTGTKFFVLGSDTIFVYDLTVPYTLSSAVYTGVSKLFNLDGLQLVDLRFSPDGNNLFLMSGSHDEVNQYTLTSKWDINTATYSHNLFVNTQETAPQGFCFSSDGNKLFICGNTGYIHQYNLNSSWNILDGVYMSRISSGDLYPTGLTVSSDGKKLFNIRTNYKSIQTFDTGDLGIVDKSSYIINTNVLEGVPSSVTLKDISVKQIEDTYTLIDAVLTTKYKKVSKIGKGAQFKVVGDTNNTVTKIETKMWK